QGRRTKKAGLPRSCSVRCWAEVLGPGRLGFLLLDGEEANDLLQVGIVPGGTQTLGGHTPLAGHTLEQRQRYLPLQGPVSRGVGVLRAAVVLQEDDVEDPVHALDAPVAADHFFPPLPVQRRTADVVVLLATV